MLLIPIGQEDAEVRRMPWISWALIALNVLVFAVMATDARSRDWEVTFQNRITEMAEYWIQHPYLSLPSEVAQLLGEDRARQIGDLVRQEAGQAGGAEKVEADTRAREQAELTRLARQAMDVYRSSPHYRNGFIPAHPDLRGLLGSLFIHADWKHLLGNMLMLFVVGPFLEDVWGRPLFGLLYVVWGLGAGLSHAAVHPASIAPLVGASGAIAGVMGAFLIRMHRRRIRFLFLPIIFLPFIRFTFGAPAFVVLPFWFGEQLLAARLVPDAPIAWWAHIGGFVLGMAAAFAVKASRVEERFINPSIEGEIGWQQHPGLVRAGELREAGRFGDAREEILRVLQAEPANVDGWSALYEVAFQLKQPDEEARAATRLLELHLASGDLVLTEKLLDEALTNLRAHLPGRFYALSGAYREKAGDLVRAVEMYQTQLFRQPADASALRAAVRLGEIHAAAGRPRDARHAFAWALLHPACTDQWRLKVEGLHADMERAAPAMSDPPGWRASLPPAPSGPVDPMSMSMSGSRPLQRPSSASIPRPVRPATPTAAFGGGAPPPAPPGGRGVGSSVAAANPPVTGAAAGPSTRFDRRFDLWIWAGTATVATVGGAALAIFLLKAYQQDRQASSTAAMTAPADAPQALPAATPTPRPAVPSAAPAGAVAVPPPSAGAVPVPAYLRITFACPFQAGHLVVKRGETELASRTFDFGKRNEEEGTGGQGLVQASVDVPAGPIELKVWLIAADRSVNEQATVTGVLPEGAPRVLRLSYSGPGTFKGTIE